MQDLYANSQQMASGIYSLLETALSEGRAIHQRPEQGGDADAATDAQGTEQDEDIDDGRTVARLSNAALLASSILATHGNAEVCSAVPALQPSGISVSLAPVPMLLVALAVGPMSCTNAVCQCESNKLQRHCRVYMCSWCLTSSCKIYQI